MSSSLRLHTARFAAALMVLGSFATQQSTAEIMGGIVSHPTTARSSTVYFAADGAGKWSFVVSRGNPNAAAAQALSQCGSGCTLQAREPGRCVAIAESRAGGYWFGIGIGNTASRVEATALHGCRIGAPSGTCRIVKEHC